MQVVQKVRQAFLALSFKYVKKFLIECILVKTKKATNYIAKLLFLKLIFWLATSIVKNDCGSMKWTSGKSIKNSASARTSTNISGIGFTVTTGAFKVYSFIIDKYWKSSFINFVRKANGRKSFLLLIAVKKNETFILSHSYNMCCLDFDSFTMKSGLITFLCVVIFPMQLMIQNKEFFLTKLAFSSTQTRVVETCCGKMVDRCWHLKLRPVKRRLREAEKSRVRKERDKRLHVNIFPFSQGFSWKILIRFSFQVLFIQFILSSSWFSLSISRNLFEHIEACKSGTMFSLIFTWFAPLDILSRSYLFLFMCGFDRCRNTRKMNETETENIIHLQNC